MQAETAWLPPSCCKIGHCLRKHQRKGSLGIGEYLNLIIENDLELPFDAKKAQLSSSSECTAQAVANLLGTRVGQITDHTVKHGIDPPLRGHSRRKAAKGGKP